MSSAAAVIGNKVEVNGVNLYYEKAGHGKQTLLLLPGAIGCCDTNFRPQIDGGLNHDKFTVICVDPRGYGKSRPPERDFPVDFLNRDANDAAKLMEQKRSLANWTPQWIAPTVEVYGDEETVLKIWNDWVDGYTKIYNERQGDICTAELGKIKCPTLILHGELDPVVGHEHPVFLQTRIIGSRMIVLPGAKHSLHLRYPKEFSKHVETFVLKEESP